MKFQDAFLPKISKHTVDVNEGQPRGVADMLLSKRKVHFLDLVAWPLRTEADEQI